MTIVGVSEKIPGVLWDTGGAGWNVKHPDFGAVGDGVANDRAAFVAVEAAGSHTLVPAGTYKISTNLTLSKAITFMPGAVLKPAGGVTVTINGALSAGLYQCFDTSASGTISLGYGVSPYVVPHWWGAKGDGVSADESAAFIAAVASLTAPSTLYIPHGFYNIAAAVTMPTAFNISIVGDGMYSSRIAITSGGAMSSLFSMAVASQRYEGFVFRDFGVIGNAKLACVVDNFPSGLGSSAYASHTLIERVSVQTTTLYAFRLNSCYNTRFRYCELFSNTGGGLACYGLANNQNNIVVDSCNIYSNTGLGAVVGNGLNATFRSCGIENNAAGGIYAFDMRSLNVVEGYCERNGGTGYTFSSPAIGKKADIILSASPTLGVLDLTGNMECVRVVGQHSTGYNTGTGSPGVDAYVFTNKADKLTVESNQLYDATKFNYLVQVFDPTGLAVVGPVSISRNTKNTVLFTDAAGVTINRNMRWFVDERGPTSTATASPTTDVWQIADRVPRNPPVVGQPKAWACTVAGGATSTTRGNTTAYALNVYAIWSTGTTVWEVTTAGTTAGAAPSIAGKVVGDTVVDGTVTWTMRSLTTATFVSEGNL